MQTKSSTNYCILNILIINTSIDIIIFLAVIIMFVSFALNAVLKEDVIFKIVVMWVSTYSAFIIKL